MIEELIVIASTDMAALRRLSQAVTAVLTLTDSGALFEGYDGADPQRAQACAALDELEAAAAAAGPIFQHL